MSRSPIHLPQDARLVLGEALNARLADGIDLHSQIKVAHWNVKGPLFASLHPLFETFATTLAGYNDDVAERAVTLGVMAFGTARHAARVSTLPDYPQETTRDIEHVKLLSERFESYLEGIRETRALAEKVGDQDTVDLLTGIVRTFEKNTWFLLASQES